MELILSNASHLHLLLNHVPTVAFGLALALFIIGLSVRSHDLTKAGLGLFFIVAVATILTYVTGNAAESLLRGTDPDPHFPAGVLPAAIRGHEDAALLATAFMEVTGFFAWLALWQWRRVSKLAGWNVPIVLVLAIVTFGLMTRAAEKGGRINHLEVRPDVFALHDDCVAEAARLSVTQAEHGCLWPTAVAQAAASQSPEAAASAAAAEESSKSMGGTGTAREIGLFVTGQTWVWPTCETLHFVGLCMLFSVVLIVDLRMLGMIKAVPYSSVYQLLPFGMLGFGLNLVTGLLFFIGVPGQYTHNVTFYWKMVFVLLGGLNVLYFTFVDEVWNVKAGDDAPIGSKIAAASAIFIWAAVLFCGHMLPFIGNAF